MIILTLQYFLDAYEDSNGMRLVFYEPMSDTTKIVRDEIYRPYFYVSFPLSPEDVRTLERFEAKTRAVNKVDFFTGEQKKYVRVEIEKFSLFPEVYKSFKDVWENDIPFGLGYVYDRHLVFGAPYEQQNGETMPAYMIAEDLRSEFESKFVSIEEKDPFKYELLEHWFTLCSQPIPRVSSDKLGLKGEFSHEQLYLAFMLARIANIPLQAALINRQVSTWIKSILHSHLRKRNILIPRSFELRRGQSIHSVQGALTFQPRSGIYFNTVVLDFESLYASLIDVFNLSYETLNCGHSECKKHKVPDQESYICTEKRGIYSALVGALKDLRIHWFKPLSKEKSVPEEQRSLAEAASRLLKLILVSSYGVTVRIHGLAQPALAESITAYGRYALKESWEMALSRGLLPIYGDTDSLFLDNPSNDDVMWLTRAVKERLSLDLAVDRVYSVCVLPRAMKAYFGVGNDGNPDIKGVTAIKSNSPAFIQQVFKDCVKQLSKVKNWSGFEEAKSRIRRIVQEAISLLKSGRIPLEDLEYKVELHFELSDRIQDDAAALHQPYQCAVQLIERGNNVHKGDTVSFVKVKAFKHSGKTFTVKPTTLVGDFNEINYGDYIRNLRTSLNQVFMPMGIIFKEEPDATLADFI